MVFILLLIILLNVYLPWRLNNLLGIKNKIYLYTLFGLGIVSGLTAMRLITKYSNPLVSLYYNLASNWIGIVLFLSCLMIIFEIVNVIYKTPKKQTALIIIGITFIISLYSFINALVFKTAYVDIPLKNLEKEINIAQISDVHLGASRGKGYLEKIVKKVNELKPDFIVITGDIADGRTALTKDMFSPLKNLQAPAYFVYGNHDVYVGLEEIINKMKENNITVLQNDVLILNGIKLIGLNYMKADDSVYDPHQVTSQTIKDTLPVLDLSGNLPKIVLHHGPWGIEYMSGYGINLVIAGHTHAGQIFPASLIAKKRFPYNRGLADYNVSYMYVSQGAGTFLPKMRLGTNNEINFITLKPLQYE